MSRIQEYNGKHRALMREWRTKYSEYAYFTEDGIVNLQEWYKLSEEKRVVFLLKEAYSSEKVPSDCKLIPTSSGRWLPQ